MFKDLFQKCSNFDIPQQVRVYYFYFGLLLEYYNIAYTSVDGSMIMLSVDDVYELYVRIVEKLGYVTIWLGNNKK